MDTGIIMGLAITILLSACIVEAGDEYSQTVASIVDEAATPSIQKPGHVATEPPAGDPQADPSATAPDDDPQSDIDVDSAAAISH